MKSRAEQYDRQQHRESLKSRRRRLHRVKAGVEDVDEDDPDYWKYLAELHTTLERLYLDFRSLERLAESNESARQIWKETECGGYESMQAFCDAEVDALFDRDDLPSLEACLRVGHFFDQVLIDLYDLPEQPPVVDDPWTADEWPSSEEIAANLRETLRNSRRGDL